MNMKSMPQVDYKLFSTIVKLNEQALLKSIYKYLKGIYPEEKRIVNKDYILCEGNIPIMLVAHMDTVFEKTPTEIYYDAKQHIMWSPQGLGADDRAGVFAILKILQKGYRPHVCFTTAEEKGGVGAFIMTNNIQQVPFDIKYIIELDRQGICDCVFYDCANEEFEKFVETYGFITEWGTFSDIGIICPAWKVAGVNLSVGYRDEHSFLEILNTNALYNTINRVCQMLDDADKAPYFEYVEDISAKYYKLYGKYYGMFPGEDDEDDILDGFKWTNTATPMLKCSKCGKEYSIDDLFPVKTKSEGKKQYCIDCVDENIVWCEKCGEPFEAENPNDLLCYDCRAEKHAPRIKEDK